MDIAIWERGRERRGDDPPLQGGRRAAADARHLGLLGPDPGGRRRRARQGAAEARRPRHARAHPRRDRRAQGAAMADWTSAGPRGAAAGPRGARHHPRHRGLGAARAGRAHGRDRDRPRRHDRRRRARASGDWRRRARSSRTPPGSWRVQDYPLGPLLGQCCGGRVRLLVERLAEVPEGDGPFAVHAAASTVDAAPPARRRPARLGRARPAARSRRAASSSPPRPTCCRS